ncbi:hypothetical protein ABT373_40760 [Streptomyces sp. NPDC000070]|uniref:hypothetical protein n=1 Tax=Streptomyces sp. NPDC000070 TaxID=3154240 RepID=UPI00332BF14A
MREIVTFDAYGTLVDFKLNAPTVELLKDRIAEVGVDTQEFLMGVEFDHVITAEQAGAYKPDNQAFECAFQKIGAKPEEIIHVAMGREYDIIPGHDLGFK